MKKENHISQLTLELYHLGALTAPEREMVEAALSSDGELRARYEALQKSDQEIRQFFFQELRRAEDAHDTPPEAPCEGPVRGARNKRKLAGYVLGGLAAAAALLFVYSLSLTQPGEPDMHPPLIAGTETEPEAGKISKPGVPKPETPHSPANGKSPSQKANEGGQYAVMAEPNEHPPAESEVPPVILAIPEGLTFIFDGMFAGRGLTSISIPHRVTAVGRNAFADNPLIRVTIGANVVVQTGAIPGNFESAYSSAGRAAGTYIRPDISSDIWVRQ